MSTAPRWRLSDDEIDRIADRLAAKLTPPRKIGPSCLCGTCHRCRSRVSMQRFRDRKRAEREAQP